MLQWALEAQRGCTPEPAKRAERLPILRWRSRPHHTKEAGASKQPSAPTFPAALRERFAVAPARHGPAAQAQPAQRARRQWQRRHARGDPQCGSSKQQERFHEHRNYQYEQGRASPGRGDNPITDTWPTRDEIIAQHSVAQPVHLRHHQEKLSTE